MPERPVSQSFPHIRTPWKAIAAELREAIERDMVPGEPTGSIGETAKMYDVSRNTAKKAFAAVVAEGLIELVPGYGYRVPEAG